MIIVIDNYDSFTYNLVQYMAELGAELQVHRNNKISVKEVFERKPKGILISPGPGRPEAAGISLELIKTTASQIPILGVCLGHQAIAQAFGAQIVSADRLMHGKTSAIRHNDSELFRGIPSPFEATRYHSLIVDRTSMPDVLEVTAQTENKTVMGIEHKHFPMFGVQFHPESILTHEGKKLLKNFLKICSVVG